MRIQRAVLVWLGLAFAVGCTEDETALDDGSDAEAELAPAGGKADSAVTFTGVYASSTTTLKAGDVPNLELLATGAYVRNRCYHTACSLEVPETDKFDTFKSTSGKTYVRFWSFKVVPSPADPQRTEVPVVIDTYEIKKTSTGIQLRKTYTSRWLSLRKKTANALCTASGGTLDAGTCACPGPTDWPGAIFVAGLGGCTVAPGATEDDCYTSGGFYTDDDATLIGSFCRCGRGRYIADNNQCSAI